MTALAFITGAIDHAKAEVDEALAREAERRPVDRRCAHCRNFQGRVCIHVLPEHAAPPALLNEHGIATPAYFEIVDRYR
jgi:hypothetical protein